jgi:hypothetical protein
MIFQTLFLINLKLFKLLNKYSFRGDGMSSVTLRDFQPINTWKPDLDGPKWEDGNSQHLID